MYAAYDNEKVIWGIGSTAEEALADAMDWHDRNGDSDETKAEFEARLTIDPCTPGLAKEVKSVGGQLDWQWGMAGGCRIMELV